MRLIGVFLKMRKNWEKYWLTVVGENRKFLSGKRVEEMWGNLLIKLVVVGIFL